VAIHQSKADWEQLRDWTLLPKLPGTGRTQLRYSSDMTFQDWGALGDMIGGIAVVGSLVYLAIQIRQNTQQIARSIEATRLAALERNIESANRVREPLILNAEVAGLFLRGLGSYSELSGTDKFRFGLLLSSVLTAFQGAYLRSLSVGGDPMEFRGAARLVDSILENPGARAWLERNEPDWRPEFRQFVLDRLAAIDRR